MDISGRYCPEWGNPITKVLTWYALTDKWILAQKPRILKIQFAKHKKIKKKPVVAAHAFNPSTREAEVGKFLSSRPAWTTEWVPGQPGLHRETPSQKNKRNKKKKKKKKDQRMDVLFFLRIRNKIPMEGVTEAKFGANTKEGTIQRLLHLGIHPIVTHQTQTLLHTPARFCWKDPDNSCLLWGYASAWQIQKWMLTVICSHL
jgi:hypothetical protein